MTNQRERWAERNFTSLRKRFGEAVMFAPMIKDDRIGYSPDLTRQPGEISCLVKRGETGEADLSFGRTNALLKVAIGELVLQLLRKEFDALQLRAGDLATLRDGPNIQQFSLEKCDMRHPPFAHIHLVELGTEQ